MATVVAGVTAAAAALAGAGPWALVIQVMTYEAVLVVMLWSMTAWRPRAHFSAALFATCRRVRQSDGYQADGLYGRERGQPPHRMGSWSVSLGLYTVAYRVLTVFIELVSMTSAQVALPMFARRQTAPEACAAVSTSALH